jgi:microcystin-dependent protein
MVEPYVGEIRMFVGNAAPQGWMFCDGQLLSIDENGDLFSLLGTTYGGDGETTFALPDLRGRVPIHQGNSYALGQSGGAETVTLTENQLPAHSHSLVASTSNASGGPSGAVLAQPASIELYRPGTVPGSAMSSSSIASAGGGQAHANMQPFLCVRFIIALFGAYRSLA